MFNPELKTIRKAIKVFFITLLPRVEWEWVCSIQHHIRAVAIKCLGNNLQFLLTASSETSSVNQSFVISWAIGLFPPEHEPHPIYHSWIKDDMIFETEKPMALAIAMVDGNTLGRPSTPDDKRYNSIKINGQLLVEYCLYVYL